MGSVVLDGTFTNLYSPAHAIGIMVAGSATKATSVDLPSNDATSPIGVYAPNSTVTHAEQRQLHGRGRLEDAGREEQRQLHLAHQHHGLLSGSNIRFYQAATGSYKECTNAATGTAPDSGC